MTQCCVEGKDHLTMPGVKPQLLDGPYLYIQRYTDWDKAKGAMGKFYGPRLR